MGDFRWCHWANSLLFPGYSQYYKKDNANNLIFDISAFSLRKWEFVETFENELRVSNCTRINRNYWWRTNFSLNLTLLIKYPTPSRDEFSEWTGKQPTNHSTDLMTTTRILPFGPNKGSCSQHYPQQNRGAALTYFTLLAESIVRYEIAAEDDVKGESGGGGVVTEEQFTGSDKNALAPLLLCLKQ